MRILAVDPGSRNIGLAVSDPSGTIANPLVVIKHTSRERDADLIVELAVTNEVMKIIVGQSIDENGEPTFEGRRSARLASTISKRTSLPVELWDESFSTHEAMLTRRMMNVSKTKRKGHIDDLAATIILQSYLDQNTVKEEPTL